MTDKRDSARRTYSKPEVKKVKLDAEVLLAKGCKSADSNAPGQSQGQGGTNSHACKMNGFTSRNSTLGS